MMNKSFPMQSKLSVVTITSILLAFFLIVFSVVLPIRVEAQGYTCSLSPGINNGGCRPQPPCSYPPDQFCANTDICPASHPYSVPCGVACTPNWAEVPGSCTAPAVAGQTTYGTKTIRDSNDCEDDRTETCSLCTPSAPAIPPQYSPSGNVFSSVVNFDWGYPAWGHSCAPWNGTNAYYRRGDTCSGTNGWAALTGWQQETPTGSETRATRTLTNGNYCWGAVAHNGSLQSGWAPIPFTVLQPPSITGSFDSASISQCFSGQRVSGRHNSGLPTNNPITYVVRVNNAGGVDKISEVRMLFVYDGDTTQTYEDAAEVEPTVNDDIGFAARISGNSAQFSYIHNGTLNGAATSGDLGNATGTSTLLQANQAGGSRVVVVNSTTLEVHFKVRIENTMNSANYGVYATGIIDESGTRVSSNYNQGSGGFVYQRLEGWRIDNQSPEVSVGNFAPTGPESFNLRWRVSDSASGIIDLDPFCYLDGGDSIVLTDTLYDPDRTVNLPIGKPGTANCLVTSGAAGIDQVHSYTMSDVPSGNISFDATAVDGACNTGTNSAIVTPPIPWLISRNSSLTANGGVSGIQIQNSDLNGIVPGFISEPMPHAFLAEYAVYVGTTSVTNRASNNRFVAYSYEDQAVNPPAAANSESWHDFILESVSEGVTVQSVNINQITTGVAEALSSAGATQAASRFVVSIPGSLLIDGNAGAVCNANAIFFITGDLRVRPSLGRTQNGGCIFIVKGNILIEPGRQTNTSNDFSTASAYDEINGVFVTDGQFRILPDNPSTNVKRDAIYIRGAVTAQTTSLERDLGLGQAGTQPTEVFDYDPYYLMAFRDILNITEFSLREE